MRVSKCAKVQGICQCVLVLRISLVQLHCSTTGQSFGSKVRLCYENCLSLAAVMLMSIIRNSQYRLIVQLACNVTAKSMHARLSVYCMPIAFRSRFISRPGRFFRKSPFDVPEVTRTQCLCWRRLRNLSTLITT